MTAVQSWADVADLSSIEDHVNAMLTADSGVRRTMVLGSAEAHRYGGIRLVCSAHPGGTMNFRELRRHAAKFEHTAGDVGFVPDDPRDLGRASDHTDDDR